MSEPTEPKYPSHPDPEEVRAAQEWLRNLEARGALGRINGKFGEERLVPPVNDPRTSK